MGRFSKFFLIMGVFLFLSVSGAYSQSQDPMYNFHNGLAAIIEDNMNSPQSCVRKAKHFIDANIGPLQKAMQRGMQMAQKRSFSEPMSESQMFDSLEQMGNAMSQSGGMQAINRYTKAIAAFGEKYPDFAEQIMMKLSQQQDPFQGFKDY